MKILILLPSILTGIPYRFAMFKNTVGAVKEKRVCAQPFYCAVLVFGKNQVVFDIPQ